MDESERMGGRIEREIESEDEGCGKGEGKRYGGHEHREK